MSVEFLKIKRESLAAEAKIIRARENALLKQIQWCKDHEEPFENLRKDRVSMKLHRKIDVRSEARLAILAIAFLKGKSFPEIEGNSRTPFSWNRFSRLIEKYGDGSKEQASAVTTWLREADVCITMNCVEYAKGDRARQDRKQVAASRHAARKVVN